MDQTQYPQDDSPEYLPDVIPSTYSLRDGKVFSRTLDGTLERFDVSQGYLVSSKV